MHNNKTQGPYILLYEEEIIQRCQSYFIFLHFTNVSRAQWIVMLKNIVKEFIIFALFAYLTVTEDRIQHYLFEMWVGLKVYVIINVYLAMWLQSAFLDFLFCVLRVFEHY